jgi:hypothetical protein
MMYSILQCTYSNDIRIRSLKIPMYMCRLTCGVVETSLNIQRIVCTYTCSDDSQNIILVCTMHYRYVMSCIISEVGLYAYSGSIA